MPKKKTSTIKWIKIKKGCQLPDFHKRVFVMDHVNYIQDGYLYPDVYDNEGKKVWIWMEAIEHQMLQAPKYWAYIPEGFDK